MRWRRDLTDGARGLSVLVAWAFMVGAFLFALGSFPPYSQLVDPTVVGATFVFGSVFFTSAAYGQLVQVVSAGRDRLRPLGWQPRRRDWWAASVQLVGTILFNVNTVAATVDGLSIEETNRLVWGPDMFGSAAFLIASHLAWIGVCGRLWCVRRDDGEWWTAALNYVGSILFMVSAIASLVLPTTGEALNTALVNSATFGGAVCFLVGAYLLLPTTDRRSVATVG